jgi:hypothetical protein
MSICQKVLPVLESVMEAWCKVLCSANTKLEFSANDQSFRYLPVARKRSVNFTLSSTESVFLLCVFCLPRQNCHNSLKFTDDLFVKFLESWAFSSSSSFIICVYVPNGNRFLPSHQPNTQLTFPPV